MVEIAAQREVALPETVTANPVPDNIGFKAEPYRPIFRDASGELIIQWPISEQTAKAILRAPSIVAVAREVAFIALPILITVGPIALLVAVSYLPQLFDK